LLPQIDMAVNAGEWPAVPVLEAIVRRAVAAAISAADLRMPPDAELSLVFTDEAEIRSINAQWRGKDKPTNVLSFPAADIRPGQRGERMLGDIVLAAETVRREADLEGKRFEDHLTHLLVHGFLHLFGYDHIDEKEAVVMEGLETRALATLGIADPHA
jgi:probable rRNA maturation factor